jgi:hypothetical protein
MSPAAAGSGFPSDGQKKALRCSWNFFWLAIVGVTSVLLVLAAFYGAHMGLMGLAKRSSKNAAADLSAHADL